MPMTNADTTKIATSVHLPPDVHERMKAHAAKHHMPMAAVLRQALVAFLDGTEGAAAPAALSASTRAVADIENGLDRIRAEVVRLGDHLGRLRREADAEQ